MINKSDFYFRECLAVSEVDFTDKNRAIQQYVWYMLNRTQSMFKYTGLPESMPKRNIELMLQTRGFIAIPIPEKVRGVNGTLYAFAEGVGLGGERNVYYMPTKAIISSPALNWSETLTIDDDVIVIPNDSLYIGLIPMFERYATMLAENDLTMHIADINARIMSLITAPDDKTRKAANEYLKNIADGKLGVIADNTFLEGVKSQPYANAANSNLFSQLVEFEQYIKAGWLNDIGLNANYNMKREAINSTEAQLNDDALLPLILDMLHQRQEGFDKVNKMCGTDIRVELDSSWKIREEDMEGTIEQVNTVTEEDKERGEKEEEDEQTDQSV